MTIQQADTNLWTLLAKDDQKKRLQFLQALFKLESQVVGVLLFIICESLLSSDKNTVKIK